MWDDDPNDLCLHWILMALAGKSHERSELHQVHFERGELFFSLQSSVNVQNSCHVT